MILFDQTLIIKKTKFVQNNKQIMEDKTIPKYIHIDRFDMQMRVL